MKLRYGMVLIAFVGVGALPNDALPATPMVAEVASTTRIQFGSLSNGDLSVPSVVEDQDYLVRIVGLDSANNCIRVFDPNFQLFSGDCIQERDAANQVVDASGRAPELNEWLRLTWVDASTNEIRACYLATDLEWCLNTALSLPSPAPGSTVVPASPGTWNDWLFWLDGQGSLFSANLHWLDWQFPETPTLEASWTGWAGSVPAVWSGGSWSQSRPWPYEPYRFQRVVTAYRSTNSRIVVREWTEQFLDKAQSTWIDPPPPSDPLGRTANRSYVAPLPENSPANAILGHPSVLDELVVYEWQYSYQHPMSGQTIEETKIVLKNWTTGENVPFHRPGFGNDYSCTNFFWPSLFEIGGHRYLAYYAEGCSADTATSLYVMRLGSQQLFRAAAGVLPFKDATRRPYDITEDADPAPPDGKDPIPAAYLVIQVIDTAGRGKLELGNFYLPE